MERFPLLGDAGQTMAEYTVVLGVIAVGVIAAFSFFGGEIAAAIEAVAGIV